jgi:hypothetical protein
MQPNPDSRTCSGRISPEVEALLREYSVRSRSLAIWRVVIAFCVVLPAGMATVGALDWWLVLEDRYRWGLSVLVYALFFLVERRTLVALWKGPSDLRELASRVESRVPELKGDLLAAVELSAPGANGSPQFRAMLQEEMGRRMSVYQSATLLPFKWISRHLWALGGLALAVVLGFMVSGLHFPRLMVRAFLPGANLARVSRVQLELVQPSPAEGVVPFGETVPVRVLAAGARVDKAFLEVFSGAGGRQVSELNSEGNGAFTGVIPVGRGDVEYRVRAGDAMTRRLKMRALPRPRVTVFEKLYRMPAYAGGERRVVESEGELSALEGTQVELRMETDVPVQKAWIEIGSEKGEIPLAVSGGRILTGGIGLRENSSYRVRLVAEETGFENKFSPTYLIRVVPDQVPQVEWLAPAKDVLLGPQEDLGLKARASDDVGVAAVMLLVRVNEGPWTEHAWGPGTDGLFEQRWDPVSAGAARGDMVTLKLKARDLRGAQSESRPLRVTIAGDGFDSRQANGVQRWRELFGRLQDLRASAVKLEAAASAWKAAEAKPGADSGVAQKVAAARTCLEEWQGRLQAAREESLRLLKQADPGPASGRFAGVSRVLGRIDSGLSKELERFLESAGGLSSPDLRREAVQKFGQSALFAEQRSRSLMESAGVFLGGAALDAVCTGLTAASAEVGRLKDRAEAGSVPGMESRLRALLAEGAGVEELLGVCVEQVPGGGERIRGAKQELGKLRLRVEKDLAGGGFWGGESVADWLRGIRQMQGMCIGFGRESGIRQDRAIQDLGRQAPAEWRIVESFRSDWDRVLGDRRWDEVRRSEWYAGFSGQGQRSFKADGDTEEARPGSDPQFVGDLRLALAVFKGMTLPGRLLELGYQPEFERFEACLRVLGFGHRIVAAAEAAAGVYAGERWEGRSGAASISGVRQFEWMQGRLREAVEIASLPGRDRDIAEILGVARSETAAVLALPELRGMEGEFRDRFQPGRASKSLESESGSVYERLLALIVRLRDPIERVREELRAKVPSLSERMEALAAETRALRSTTEATAGDASIADPAPGSMADSKAAMTGLRDRQERLNAEVDAVRDALRAQANREDLSGREGRERARDADDALALLREPPVRAVDALEAGLRAGDPLKRVDAARQAVAEQGKLAAALDQLARHFSKKGDPEQTRAGLRAAERELGVEDELNAQYAKAEKMAELSQKTPKELLEHLEKQLPNNRLMQLQLSQISRIGVEESASRVQEAAGLEERIAERVRRNTPAPPVLPDTPAAPAAPAGSPGSELPSPAVSPERVEAATGQAAVAEAASDAGQILERSGRHEKRLQNGRTSEQLSELGKELSELGMNGVPEIRRQILQGSPDAPAWLEQAARRFAERADQLKKMPPAPSPALRPPALDPKSEPPAQAGRDSMQPNYAAEAAKPGPQEQVWMARTLDALDSQIFGGKRSEGKNGESGKPGESGTKGEQQPGAKGKEASGDSKPGEKSGDGEANPDAAGSQDSGGKGEPGDSKQMADKARSAMAAAARAAAESMRANRNEADTKDAGGQAAKDSLQAKSGSGSSPDGSGARSGELPGLRAARSGDWGRLPKKMAEELSQVRREEVSAEYRQQVETYYRVLSERAKK